MPSYQQTAPASTPGPGELTSLGRRLSWLAAITFLVLTATVLGLRALELNTLENVAVVAELLVFFTILLYVCRRRLFTQSTDIARQQALLERHATELEGSLDERAEAAVFLDAALSCSPVAFMFWDTDFRFTRVDPGMAAARDHRPADYLGKTVSEMVPDVAGIVQPALEEVARTRRVIENVATSTILKSSRKMRHLRATFYPVQKSDGTLIGIGGIFADVSTQQAQEQELRRNEERYRYVAKATRDAIYEWDIASNTLQWNEGINDLFGYAPGDVDDSPNWITELVHPDDVDQVTDTFAHALSSGADRWQLSYRLRRKDSRYASVEGRAYILRDEKGVPTRVIGAITDRTLQASLEDQLRQAQKMEAIGRLAGGIAHDFNNVLTVVRMSSEFLLEDLPAESASRQEALEIMKAADRAAGLTRQLLTFSRHQVLNPRIVVLNEVIGDIKGMLERIVPENITIKFDLAPSLDPIRADSGQMEQVILNLAINATDAMPDGGRLEIRTANADVDASFSATHVGLEPGAYVCLTVSDTGHGMDKDTVERIFEPFFTTKAMGKGTGLGLSTVHGIVTQTGGHIWVFSEPGLGTMFEIFIPRSSTTTGQMVTTRAPMNPVGSASETILVVEDEEATRDAVERSLTRAGYKVLLASNGVDALKVAADHPEIALVLTDSMMPDMGGLELAEKLQATRPEVQLLMMSGYTEQTAESERLLSAYPFIEKPFAAADLLTSIDKLLHASLV